MKLRSKKLWCVLLTLALLLSLLPAVALTAAASLDPVSYLDEKGEPKSRADYTVVSGTGTGWTNTAGTEGNTRIAKSTTGQPLSYLKIQFPAEHTHAFTYSVGPDTTITAYCTSDDCTLPDNTATLTIAAPAHKAEGDGLDASAVITDTYSIQGDAKIKYATKNGETYGSETETPPTVAGDYKASITLGKATAYVEYTIAPYAASVTKNGTTTKYAALEGDGGALKAWVVGSTLTLLTDAETTATITVDKTKTLDLNGYGIRMTGNGCVISVTSGATLTLNDTAAEKHDHYITLSGGRATAVSDTGTESETCVKVTGGYLTGGTARIGGGVHIVSPSKFTMNGGTIIGNKATDNNGGGVRVDGTFTMNGGTVSHNTARFGAGVYVSASGTFTMTDGSVSANTAEKSGGGVHVKGLFTMEGGSVSDNKAAGTESNTGRGGGVLAESGGSFALSDGYVTGNDALFGGGVYVDETCSFTMTGGTIRGNHAPLNEDYYSYGGGVYNHGKFLLTDGYVIDNDAQSGGGVYNDEESTFVMSGGSIRGNQAIHDGTEAGGGLGGGVDNSGSFRMIDGMIADNDAYKGGGVTNYASFYMYGGAISDNDATVYGGGVYNVATFTIAGGTISDNTAGTYGGGVLHSYGAILLSGEPVISGNIRGGIVFYDADGVITISDTLTYAEPISVAILDSDEPTAGTFTKGWSTYMTDADVNAYFTSADSKFIVCLADVEMEAQLSPACNVTLGETANGTVTITAGGKTILSAPGTAKVAENTEILLTAAAGTGYHFKEWQINGEKAADLTGPVGQTFTVTSDVAIKAVFEKDSGGGSIGGGGGAPTYTPTIEESAHGKITAEPRAAAEGEKVKLTATPDEGYELDTLTVKDADGKEVPLTKNTDGTYTYVQPKGKVTITGTFKVKEKIPFTNPFVDVHEGDYFYEPVMWAVQNGVTKGTDEAHFSPNNLCTRAETVTFLWRAEGSPEPNTANNPFEDVSASAYYYKAVLWAVENGVTKGTDETHFSPDAPTTREQYATFLYRIAQSHGKGFTGMWSFRLDFPDAGDVSDWAYEAMCWMVMNGVVNGMDGRLNPQGNAVRAHVVSMLYRYQNLA